MKILVLGGTGMAGHTIALYFIEAGHDVTVFSTKAVSFCRTIIGDITDFDYTKTLVEQGNFDAIINAIGILNEAAENNKSQAVLINTYLPHFLSDLIKNSKTKLIHMSTDCVFSGDKGGYSENDLKDGKTFYDKTKALGEVINDKDLTFRNSIIGPDMSENGIGLFNWFMKQETQINGFCKAIWTGVTTLTLAKAMEKAIIDNITGVYNLVNNEKISKYSLLKLFNKHFKDDKILIEEDYRTAPDKSLINNRQDFSFVVPTYEEMIVEMKEWIYKFNNLYPHYFKKGE